MVSYEGLSENNKAILIAVRKGVKIIDGEIVSPVGKKKHRLNTGGYPSFNIKDRGFSYRITVHRLVAYQKFGDAIFEPGIMVRHLDGNKENNMDYNIEIGTASQNQQDIPLRKRQERAKKAMPNSRIDEHEVVLYLHSKGYSQRRICRMMGMTIKNISYIIKKSVEARLQEIGLQDSSDLRG